MSVAVRPIRLPGASACEPLRRNVRIALDAWARDWVAGCASGERKIDAPDVRALNGASVAGRADYREVVRAEVGCIWFRCDPEARSAFDHVVVGADSMSQAGYVDDWVAEVSERAWHARNRAICAALLGAPLEHAANVEIDSNVFAFGSGAVQVTAEALGLHAIVDSGVWRGIAPTPRASARPLPRLTPLDQAMSGAAARLAVMLGSVEIPLPRILDLRCGDVLRLPRRLDEGIDLLCEGQPLARALLGERNGRKCVRVIAKESRPVEETR